MEPYTTKGTLQEPPFRDLLIGSSRGVWEPESNAEAKARPGARGLGRCGPNRVPLKGSIRVPFKGSIRVPLKGSIGFRGLGV